MTVYATCVIESSAWTIARCLTISRLPFEAPEVLPMRSWSKPRSRRMKAISPRMIVGSRSASVGELSLATLTSLPVATFRR